MTNVKNAFWPISAAKSAPSGLNLSPEVVSTLFSGANTGMSAPGLAGLLPQSQPQQAAGKGHTNLVPIPGFTPGPDIHSLLLNGMVANRNLFPVGNANYNQGPVFADPEIGNRQLAPTKPGPRPGQVAGRGRSETRATAPITTEATPPSASTPTARRSILSYLPGGLLGTGLGVGALGLGAYGLYRLLRSRRRDEEKQSHVRDHIVKVAEHTVKTSNILIPYLDVLAAKMSITKRASIRRLQEGLRHGHSLDYALSYCAPGASKEKLAAVARGLIDDATRHCEKTALITGGILGGITGALTAPTKKTQTESTLRGIARGAGIEGGATAGAAVGTMTTLALRQELLRKNPALAIALAPLLVGGGMVGGGYLGDAAARGIVGAIAGKPSWDRPKEKKAIFGGIVGGGLGALTAPTPDDRLESTGRGFVRGMGTTAGGAIGGMAGLSGVHGLGYALTKDNPTFLRDNPALAISLLLGLPLAGVAGGGYLGDSVARGILGKPSWDKKKK